MNANGLVAEATLPRNRFPRPLALLLAGATLACGQSLHAQYVRPVPSRNRQTITPYRPPVPVNGQMIPVTVAPPPAVPQVTTHQRLVQLASKHPVCLVIGEGLASRFIATTTRDEGPFDDFVMGAQIHGTQKTNARTSLDFTPDPAAAKILFVLQGVTENQSIAQLPQAAIRTSGTFEFELTKQIEFNGHGIRTWSPSAFMTINQKHLGASTAVSNVPLLGPLANNIVLNAAEQRKPVSEGIAAHRVTQQVAPRFNSNLDEQLAKLNERLQGPLKSRMTQSGMMPTKITTSTTNDAMLCGLDFQGPIAESADASGIQPISTRKRTPTHLVTRQLIAGASPQYGAEPEMVAPKPYSLDSNTLRDRGCLLIHASLVENLADRFRLEGREVTDTELMRVLGTLPPETTGNAPQLYTLVLADESPLTATVDQGEMILNVRAAIRPVIGIQLPEQLIRINLRPTMTTDQIVLDPDLLSIEPSDGDPDNKLGAASAMIIRQAIEQRLKDVTLSRSFQVPRQAPKPSFPMRVQTLTLVDGWITATIEQSPLPQSAALDTEVDSDAELKNQLQ